MDLYDVVIVGSGPSGVAAALALSEKKFSPRVLMLDSGMEAESSFRCDTLRSALDLRSVAATAELLGPRFEALNDFDGGVQLHPKLRARAARHVLSGLKYHVENSAGSHILASRCSHARGGMSSAWGGQLLRYTEADVEALNWPFQLASFQNAYSRLESHIGISGVIDDAATVLGPANLSSGPVAIVPSAMSILRRHERRLRGKRLSRPALCLGRARLAINGGGELSSVVQHQMGETEFFETNQPGLYTAEKTLSDLIQKNAIEYRPSSLVTEWKESADLVNIQFTDGHSGQVRSVKGRHVLLACGAMQTAALVANVYNPGKRMEFPFIDHTPMLLPIFVCGALEDLEAGSYPIQLVGGFRGGDDFFSVYYPGGLLWSSLLEDLPLSFRGGSKAIRTILRRLLVVQIWGPSGQSDAYQIIVNNRGPLTVRENQSKKSFSVFKHAYEFAKLGALSLPTLSKSTPSGWGFHHAGTLPSRICPQPFETHLDGRLWNSQRVRVIDASVFPSLPAKNHSLTMMANAHRLADELDR